MRAAALLAALLALTASAQQSDPRFKRFTQRSPQGRSTRGLMSNNYVSLADALQAGDKAGNWWAMKGDGTMLAGSTVTLVATGSPTNTTEGGWPVRTYTNLQNDQEPANAAFPASDFSVCKHMRSTALTNAQLMAFGSSGAVAGFSALPFEQQTNGNVISYISNGASGSTVTSATAMQAGNWYLLCFTYQRVGAGTSVGTLYLNGASVNSSSTLGLAQALSSVWTTNGYAGGAGGVAGSTRGVFVTYKLLSAADIARLYAAVGP